MNRNNILFIFIVSSIFSVEIFWDLGVGITEFASHTSLQTIQASTYHRLEGTKKYYQMDYTSALFHTSTFANVVITLFYFEQGTDENYYDFSALFHTSSLFHTLHIQWTRQYLCAVYMIIEHAVYFLLYSYKTVENTVHVMLRHMRPSRTS